MYLLFVWICVVCVVFVFSLSLKVTPPLPSPTNLEAILAKDVPGVSPGTVFSHKTLFVFKLALWHIFNAFQVILVMQSYKAINYFETWECHKEYCL
jgi:hypothetical protein